MDVLIVRWRLHEESPNSSSCLKISAGRRQSWSRKTTRLSKDLLLEHSSRMWIWVCNSIPFQNVNIASVPSGSECTCHYRKKSDAYKRLVHTEALPSHTCTMSLNSTRARREKFGMINNSFEILLIAAWKICWLAWFSGSSKPWALDAPEVKAAANTTPVPNPISIKFLPYTSTASKTFCKLNAVKLPWNPRVFPWAPSETLSNVRITRLVYSRLFISEPVQTNKYQYFDTFCSSREKSKLEPVPGRMCW